MSTLSKRLLWIALATAALAALLLPKLLPSDRTEAPIEATEEAVLVESVTVRPGRLEERLATTGTVRAEERVEIRSEISGILERVHFDEGSVVEAGELLVQIDDDRLVAERDRAAYRVELARISEAREKDLLAQGLLSQDEYDRALSQLNVLEAELRLVEAQLEKTQIRAPFRGRIGLREVSAGAALTPAVRIATLQAVDTVKVEFTVPERYAGRVRRGDSVLFRVRGLAGSFEGEIYALEPAVDPETRSLRARARSPNPGGRLIPGAFADVEIVVGQIEDALSVPAIAVVPELGGKKVFVIEEGRAEPRIVETGIRTQTEVQIVRGLAPGDRVIVTGVQQLRSGLAVRERAGETS